MQGFTYTELFQALQDWPEDTDSTANGYLDNIPRIVQMGELRLVRDLNLDLFDVLDTSSVVTLGSRIVTKPADLLVARTLWVVIAGVRTRLIHRSRDYVINYSLDTADTDTPKYYAENSDLEWMVAKVPSANGIVESLGVYRPESLVDAETTWLGDHCGDVLFAACLAEAEHLLKADDRYKDYIDKYTTELLPVARTELRNLIRAGDYAPYRPAATKAG